MSSNIKNSDFSSEYLAYAYALIHSDKFDFRTPEGKALRFDINEPNKNALRKQLPADLVSIEMTKGGKALEELLANNSLSMEERDFLSLEAQSKFLRQASGDVTIVIGNGFSCHAFRTYEMSEILGNDYIQSLNGIPKKQFEVALLSDRTPYKDDSYYRIVGVLKGEFEPHNLEVKQLEQKVAVEALNKAVRIYLDKELLEADKELRRTRQNLFSAAKGINSHEKIEQEARKKPSIIINFIDHLRSKTHLEQMTTQFWNEFAQAKGRYDALSARVTSPTAIQEIKTIAADILRKQEKTLQMTDMQIATKSLGLVQSNKKVILNDSEHKLSQLESEKVERYVSRKR